MKNLLSLVLALVMVMAMTLTAMATEPTKVTPSDDAGFTLKIDTDRSGHKYQAYQIFKGDLAQETVEEETKTILSNIEWGNGVNGPALLTALQSLSEGVLKDKFKGCGNAADVAEVLSSFVSKSDEAKAFSEFVVDYLSEGGVHSAVEKTESRDGKTVTTGYEFTGLGAGYYLVRDKVDSLNEDNESYTSYIMQVVGDVTAKPKASVPTVEKEVKDEVDDAETADGWGKTADHAINEIFQFKLTATLQKDENRVDYETYKVTFNDTMSSGITFEKIDEVFVEVDGEEILLTKNSTDNGYTATDVEKGKWTITIADLKKIKKGNGSLIDITKEIKVVVTYSAFLNENAKANAPGTTAGTENENSVYLEYSNNPNAGGEGNTGKTPEDHVWVFTYLIPSNKVKKEGNESEPLEGAGFTVYEKNSENVEADGKTIKKTATPMKFIYDADKNVYCPAPNPVPEDVETVTEIFSRKSSGDSNGKATFNIEGLDVGTYVVKETTTPPGYNTCENVVIEVGTGKNGNHKESEDGSSATVTYQMKVDNDISTENVVTNNKGVTLPETGGIGTTIFTVSGIILVIIAGVLLVTKKRMSKEE